jgi:DNA ligase (NAD+)
MKNSEKKDKDIVNKIKNLILKINYHDNLYYNKNSQEISDFEYDLLRKKLENLEKKYSNLIQSDSPSKKVGNKVNKEFKTVKHNYPMLSLNNAYKEEEVKKFYNKCKDQFNNIEIIAETKVDGLSASLIYEGHKLVRALTRGDGLQGEEITNNILFVEGVKKSLPKHFPKKLEIRGEVFMSKTTFIKLNNERSLKGLQLFSTSRNAAAGSIRQLDPKITKERNLKFFGYTLICDDSYFGKNIFKTRQILELNNFALNNPCSLCYGVEDMLNFYNYINTNRDKLEYDIDGIVYKINSYEQEEIGFTSRFPKWALAHKFPAEEAITKITDVKFQLGRTGSITPVAVLDEVNIGGVKITRATLHNQDEIKRLNIHIGDEVKLQRAGDVIPKILSVSKNVKNNNKKKIIFPNRCPSCDEKLFKLDKEVALRCLNYNYCEEQIIYRICHFVSRQALNIDGLGEKQIRFLWKKNIIKNIDDIFSLRKRQYSNHINLLQYEGWGEKSVNNLFNSIDKSSKVSFAKFIYSLGIRHVGKELAISISKSFINVDNFIETFLSLESSNPIELEGIGEIVIKSIKSYFSNKKCLELTRTLINILDISYAKRVTGGIYENHKAVITGSFNNYSRELIKEKFEAYGGKIVASISKSTNFLIVGENPGSKLEKAKKLNINIKGLDFVNELMND